MAINIGQTPQKCTNCGSQGGFTRHSVRIDYDTQTQIGSLAVDQIPRTENTIWVCDACQARIEVARDLT